MTKPVLLVEGRSELRVIPYLLHQAGVPWPDDNRPVDIRYKEGYQKVITEGVIPAFIKESRQTAAGIVIDADSNPKQRWDQLRHRIVEVAPGFPKQNEPSGVIHLDPELGVRIGVWIMPDNVMPGMLESFLLDLREENDELKRVVDDSLLKAKSAGATFRDSHKAKAELHTWLAWQDPPGLQMHVAVEKGLLLPDTQRATAFVTWFRKLFRV